VKHTYRLFLKESTSKSNLVATFAVEKKEESEVKELNAQNPDVQWFKVNRKLQLVR